MADITLSLLGERPSLRYVFRRCIGGAFDLLVVVGLFVALAFRAGQAQDDGSVQVSGLPALLVPVFWVCYFPLMEGMFGATIGKLLVDQPLMRNVLADLALEVEAATLLEEVRKGLRPPGPPPAV